MAEVQRKEERASNEDEYIHTDVNNTLTKPQGGRVAMAYNRSNLAQGADIFQEKETVVKEEISIVDQVTITLANFSFVQVGRSGTILTEVKPCLDQGCRQQESTVNLRDTTKGRLMKNSTPDDACKVNSNSKTEYIDEDQPRSSDESQTCTECIRDVEYHIPLIKKHGSLRGNLCETVMKKLEELQDNGRFEAHEDLACNLLDFFTKNKDPDMLASLMIERGVAFYYANDLKMSRKLYRAVIRMGESLTNRNLLQGRAYVQLATAYRYEFGKAIQYLQKAEELLSHHEPGEDTAELCYYYGVKWLYFYWNSFADRKGRQVFKVRAREYLEQAISNCARDERPRVQLKKKRYFSLRFAALHLDCGTRAARETRQVSNEDITAAKKHLDFVEYQLSSGLPLGTKIQLLKARSDQYYRQGKLCMAKETAQEALALARRINMNMEIIPLNERIEESVNLLALPSPDISTESLSDSGWSADGSSSN